MSCSLYHHSRQSACRSPQGAIPAGQPITLTLYAGQEYETARVTLRFWMEEREQVFPMERHTDPATGALRFCAVIPLSDEPGLAWYYFIIDQPGNGISYYGGESGRGAWYPHIPPGYQITLYDGAFTVPRWFRESVMYQIFPDRFHRAGNSGEAGIAYHRALGRTLRVHENWNEAPCYLPAEGEPHYVPNDFFLGNLSGIQEKIPYLQDLGVTCLYLNPVFESYSNHRYDTADYKKIDPILGTNEEFAALCKALKQAGIRVMLDGVFSHTGADSLYFNKYGHYPGVGAYQSADSSTRSWYYFHGLYGEGYRSWWNFPEMPEVNELDPGYQEFIMGEGSSLLRHWADLGASNWRLDVADELPDLFIARMRRALKRMDPEAVLLGEVWEDASTKEAYGVRRQYVQGHELDSVMNYPFQAAVSGFLLDRLDAYALNQALQCQRERYPKPFYYAAMNLLSTHDSVRILTVLGGAPSRDALTREEQAHFALTPRQEEEAKRRFLLATALQVAVPGVPCLYYGDEAGVFGMADPFNRKPYPWGQEDAALRESVRQLTVLRKESPALRAGHCKMGALSPDLFAVLRYTQAGKDAFSLDAPEDAVLLVCNRSALPVHTRFGADQLEENPDGAPVHLHGAWQEAIACAPTRHFVAEDGMLEAVVPPCGTLLLRRIR